MRNVAGKKYNLGRAYAEKWVGVSCSDSERLPATTSVLDVGILECELGTEERSPGVAFAGREGQLIVG